MSCTGLPVDIQATDGIKTECLMTVSLHTQEQINIALLCGSGIQDETIDY